MPEPSLITSTKNPLVKRIRSLAKREQRDAEDRLVVEGVRMLEEVLDAGVAVELLVYVPAIGEDPRAAGVLARAKQGGIRLAPASPHVVAACSHVETPQGMMAVVAKPRVALSTVLGEPNTLLVIADRIQDPGNLGTIIRIADAAGATAVVVTRGTVDPTNPKTVRATMGSIFHLPVVEVAADEIIAALEQREVRVLIADQAGAIDYTDADYRRPVAMVLGNEGQGPDARWREVATATVRIPLYGRAESLNVAVAAGLLLYEARRQPPSRR